MPKDEKNEKAESESTETSQQARDSKAKELGLKADIYAKKISQKVRHSAWSCI